MVGSGSRDAHACDAAQATRSADGSELNQPFTSADVVRSINLLHRGSSTLGFLSVDALRAAAPLLAAAVAALFNACAQVGSLPPAWALCAITPIHKSGPVTDPGNYRGIAVGTVLAKMYATLLNSPPDPVGGGQQPTGCWAGWVQGGPSLQRPPAGFAHCH